MCFFGEVGDGGWQSLRRQSAEDCDGVWERTEYTMFVRNDMVWEEEETEKHDRKSINSKHLDRRSPKKQCLTCSNMHLVWVGTAKEETVVTLLDPTSNLLLLCRRQSRFASGEPGDPQPVPFEAMSWLK